MQMKGNENTNSRTARADSDCTLGNALLVASFSRLSLRQIFLSCLVLKMEKAGNRTGNRLHASLAIIVSIIHFKQIDAFLIFV